MPAPVPRLTSLLPLVALLSACRAGAPGIAHDDPALPLLETERVRLRSDLPKADAEAFAAQIDALEAAVDSSFPWLERHGPPPLTLVVAAPARFSLLAQDHGASEHSGAFVCARGELVARYRPEVWGDPGVGAPLPTEPRVRPLASAVLRRRVLALGHTATERPEVEPTWIEEGLVSAFVEIASTDDEQARSVRIQRERLLDAFLPLYLGGRPMLARICDVKGRGAKRRVGTRAMAWAAVRYLSNDAALTPLLALALRRAAGDEAADDAWPEALQTLAAHEDRFERFLLDATISELLIGFRDGKTAVDRWECADAIRLIANIDLNSDAGHDERVAQFEGCDELLERAPPAPRFLAKYERDLRRVHEARSRLEAIARLRRRIRKEFERRTRGYGHPAIEFARGDLGRAIQRALASLEP